MCAAEDREVAVVRIISLHQLRLLPSHLDLAVPSRRQALLRTPVRALIKVEERQPEAAQPHGRARLCVEKPQQQLHDVVLLTCAVFWRVEVDLRKLAVQSVPKHIPRPVVRLVCHLHVDRPAGDAVNADIAIEQRGRQGGVEPAEVRVEDGDRIAEG